MKNYSTKGALFFIIAFICVTVHAGEQIKDSQDTTQTAISSTQTAISTAKMFIISSCVTPQGTTECNSTTSVIVSAADQVLSQLSSALVGGTAGAIASGAISAAMCLAIRCDSSSTQVTTCQTECLSECWDTYEVATPDINSAKREQCISDCVTSQTTDTAHYKNDYKGTGDFYPGCIDASKASAQTQQTKCQSTCAGMAAALAALDIAKTGLERDLDKLDNQINTGGDGNNNNNNYNNNNYHSNNNFGNNNNVDDGVTDNGSSSGSSSVGSSIGLEQGATSGLNSKAGVSSSLSTRSGGASSGTGLKEASKGTGSSGQVQAEGTDSGSASISGASSDGSPDYGSGSPYKGLTKKSDDKKGLLDKNVDLFEAVRKIHTNLYQKQLIGRGKQR